MNKNTAFGFKIFKFLICLHIRCVWCCFSWKAWKTVTMMSCPFLQDLSPSIHLAFCMWLSKYSIHRARLTICSYWQSFHSGFSNWVEIWRTWSQLWTNPVKLDHLVLARVLLLLSCCQTTRNCWCHMTPGTCTRPCFVSWRNTPSLLKFLLQVALRWKYASFSLLFLLISDTNLCLNQSYYCITSLMHLFQKRVFSLAEFKPSHLILGPSFLEMTFISLAVVWWDNSFCIV